MGGVPPGKLHAYVKVLEAGAQLFMVAVGFMFAIPQEFGIVAIEAVGGFLTIIVWVADVTVPQEFVTASLIEYVPASVKLKDGFADIAERNLFRLLVSVSGVGGTSALLMLSSLTAVEIQTAIATANVAVIKSVKGIGEKTAQRVIVDLKDKMGKSDLSAEIFSSANNTLKEEALSALVMLGFNKQGADKVLDKIIRTEGTGQTVEQLIKSALKNL